MAKVEDTKIGSLFIGQTASIGLGVFTGDAFVCGDRVARLEGIEHRGPALMSADPMAHPNWIGVGAYRWIDPDPPFSFLNHSCDPNLGMANGRDFVALRAIAPGEELTLDYAITECDPDWQMDCQCGHRHCRGVVRAIQFLPAEAFRQYLPNINPFFQALYESEHRTSVTALCSTALGSG